MAVGAEQSVPFWNSRTLLHWQGMSVLIAVEPDNDGHRNFSTEYCRPLPLNTFLSIATQ